jgi:hypothetical protein
MKHVLPLPLVLMAFASPAQQLTEAPLRETANTGMIIQGDRGGCTENLTLTITLDNFGSETTWALYDNTGNIIEASGGPYGDGLAGTAVVENICLYQGCYRLEVSDAGGNGITDGGYVLRDAAGRRIIDANGLFGSMSAMSDQQRFCLPVSNQGLIQTWCDRTNLVYASHTQVYASFQPGAKAYQFWFFDPHGSYSRRVYLTHPWVVPYNLVTTPVPADIDLNVRVRTFVEGGLISPWGRACVIRLNTPGRAPEPVLEELANDHGVRVLPNPSSGSNARIELSTEGWSDAPFTLEVLDASGRIVHTDRFTSGLRSYGISTNLLSGLYVARVTQGDQQAVTRFTVED